MTTFISLASRASGPTLAPSKNPSPAAKTLAPTPQEATNNLLSAINTDQNIPSDVDVKSNIGKLKLMDPQQLCMTHPAAPLLQSYANSGCPVDCGPNWSLDHIQLLLKQGPHISGKNTKAITFLRQETSTKVQQGYTRVVKWGDIKHNHPPQLKLSPVAMIPHKSKAFCCILDLSFGLRHQGKQLASVNSATRKQALPQAMTQLGQCVKRLVHILAKYHLPHKPFLFSKLDIKDGFWRMAVGNQEAWNFCYILPNTTQPNSLDDVEIVVPNSLQMGWCESPPFFCSGTETARDIIANIIKSLSHTPPTHPFENIMLDDFLTHGPSTPQNNTIHNPETDITELEVYVDDFCALTNVLDEQHLQRTSRCMIEGIHSVSPPR